MAKLAKRITVDVNTPDCLEIDGVKFGFYLADEEVETKVTRDGLATVRLTLIAETVAVIPKADPKDHGQ